MNKTPYKIGDKVMVIGARANHHKYVGNIYKVIKLYSRGCYIDHESGFSTRFTYKYIRKLEDMTGRDWAKVAVSKLTQYRVNL